VPIAVGAAAQAAGANNCSDASCWRRLPEWLRRWRSALAPANSLSLTTSLRNAKGNTREFCFPAHESHGFFYGVFLSLFIGVYTISRSDFPATPAHAATCPPKGRGRFQACVAEDLVTTP